MISFGITGSLASGKSSVSKFLCKNKYSLFSADAVVRSLYKEKSFIKKVRKKFLLKNDIKIKPQLKNILLKDNKKFKELEKLIHPIVRKKMKNFIKIRKKEKLLFLEIPLLIESKLMNYFDVIIFVKATKKNRLKRYINRGGDKKIFNTLNKKQKNQSDKIKLSNYVIHNNKSLKELKKTVKYFIKKYE
jgi:dephospho-CoA kinase